MSEATAIHILGVITFIGLIYIAWATEITVNNRIVKPSYSFRINKS